MNNLKGFFNFMRIRKTDIFFEITEQLDTIVDH